MNERRTVDFREGVRPVLGRLLRPESLLVAPRTHLARRSTERRIAKFCDVVLAGLARPIPSDPDHLFAVLRADVEQRFNADRGALPYRPVLLFFREFPEETASGLTARFDDRVVIIVESKTNTLHQFVIFAHEMWHALKGECLSHRGHSDVATAAARSLGGELASDDLVAMAARSHENSAEENDAEKFGLQLGARLREHLQGDGTVPITGLAGRIQSSLGRGY
ncbi:toxin-antitoxin system, toxin component [Streptomyces sp. H27-H5]|uniref:toxin-antitoxin system, toxin component n=1 Tax=Streptomyces sp. H27-H5 TaxID=2996460 RepID=UPI00226DA798|nr:toxin-antitoxin system, toxin component [Streptomyces sp. H27-H5]MCY0960652.1 toxin-antitoxin system, toxin component [Streptomyces sp. H27-H5]